MAASRPLPAKPSLAVLPLANLSGDARWERLADGITEDIITDLARDPDLFVIARNSTLPYKGKAADVRQVGRELGVRYVLEGSLQAVPGRVRVTAQLIDATTGGHLWAERYDRPEADLFAVQDEVARNVASALGGWYGRVNEARRAEAKRRPPASLEAYDLYLLGLEQKHQLTKASMHDAIRSFSRAVELDPGFARGWTMLGAGLQPLSRERLRRRCVRRQPALCRSDPKKAADLDPFDPFTQAMLGSVRGLEGDPKGAEVAFDRALALAPNDAQHADSRGVEPAAHRRAGGRGRAARATRDGPGPGVTGRVRPGLAVAQYTAGRYEDAVGTLRLAPLEGGEMLMFWAMAQAQLGHVKEARKAARASGPSSRASQSRATFATSR